ncbi:MAG: flagellar basal body P-ring protein FlgI [Pseudomonadaceae bacterium]|nr:flagellar basal body P-ring protein FlgI [Pseudomonadaceae bacterium]
MTRLLSIVVSVVLLLSAPSAFGQRIKDLASVAGVRSNPLIGYGLVVGLDGSGDQTSQTPFTVQTFRNMLREFGIQMPPGVNPQLKNVAAVSIHAKLPAFAKPGQTIDITVSSLGNAKSLRGGTLLVTPLKGLDNNVYAIAQGNLVVGGFGAQGQDGSSITVNVPSVGRVPGGAMVERPAPGGFGDRPELVLNLHESDFTTARRLAERINLTFGGGVAAALDGRSVQVRAPSDANQKVSFLSVIENLEVTPGETAARVIINSRTGTIVMGENVQVLPAAITHGNLSVMISENMAVSQPNALAEGQTVVVPNTDIEITEESGRMFYFAPGAALSELVNAVNDVGAAPGDLMAILEALKQAGALRAEIVVI